MGRMTDTHTLDWPPRPMSSAAMRILHLGHILDDKTVLCSAKADEQSIPGAMVPGRSSVVHLLIRQEQAKDEKEGTFVCLSVGMPTWPYVLTALFTGR